MENLKNQKFIINENDNKQRNIVVISLNQEDFNNWRINKIKKDGLDTVRKFNIGDTRFYCISKLNNLCSLNVDEITETEYAKENKDYEKIKLIAMSNLK